MKTKRLSSSVFTALTFAAVLSVGTLAACGSNDDPPPEATPVSLSLKKIGGFETGTLAASEITAFDADSRRLFVVNGALGTVDVLDLSKPEAPVKLATITISDIGGAANSVAVHEGLVALAVEANPKTSPGKVAFYDARTLARLAVVTVGAQPDMIVFTPDGRQVLTANEGEPNSYGAADSVDPEGSISIVTVNRSGASVSPSVATADFRAFNSKADALRAAGVRLYGPGASVAQDLEPEYITIADDGNTAWVTLQENNAIATVDIAAAKVTAIHPLGLKDHLLAGAGLDPSDEDGGTNTNSGTPTIKIGPWPLKGMYLPDAIASYTAGGKRYLVTANEGDARADWPGFNEETRVRAHCDKGLDPAVFTGATGTAADPLLFDSNLGRLRITNAPNGGDNGKNAAGQCNKLWAFGARSFTIWEAGAGGVTRVFDSGDDFEKRTQALGAVANFNAGHDNNTLDSRSPNKGPEPESVTLARFGTRTFAFIGLERIGGVMVYDVTDPARASYVTYLNTRTGAAGDRGPEGLTFIAASQSPNGKPLLIVANEISGSTAVLQIDLAY